MIRPSADFGNLAPPPPPPGGGVGGGGVQKKLQWRRLRFCLRFKWCRGRILNRQREAERGAATGWPLDPHAATVQVDVLAHQCEPEPDAAV